MIDEQLKSDLSAWNAETRRLALLELEDHFRGHWHWEPGEVREIAALLFEQLGDLPGWDEQEAILRNLIEATQCGQGLDYRPLIELLPKLDLGTIDIVFSLLYLSGDPDCHAQFQSYLHHELPSVRRKASQYMESISKF